MLGKGISRTVAIFLVAGLFYAPTTPTTHAYDLAFEVNPAVLAPLLAISIESANTAVSTDLSAGFDFESITIESILNGIAWAVAKTAVNSITQSVVRWINSGFNGSPAFVTDLEQHLTDLGDVVAGNFISGLAGTDFMCSPFRLQITLSIAEQYYAGSSLKGCTLSGIASNVDQFINGTFSDGGWAGWFALTTEPRNNPYGSYLAASAELGARLVNARGQEITLLNWGSGFMSWCDTSGGTGKSDKGGATTCTNEDGTRGTIQTPGSIIENELADSLGSGMRQLELADSINEIVSALGSQLMTQALGGLLSLTQPSQGGGRSILDQYEIESIYSQNATSTSQKLVAAIAVKKQPVTEYLANWGSIGGATQNAQLALSSLASTSAAYEEARSSSRGGRDSDELPPPPTCYFSTGDTPSSALNTKVLPTLTQVATAQAKGQVAMLKYTELENQVKIASTTADFGKASEDYQKLASGDTGLSTSEITYAKQQNRTTSNGGDISNSLYVQMSQITTDARTCEQEYIRLRNGGSSSSDDGGGGNR